MKQSKKWMALLLTLALLCSLAACGKSTPTGQDAQKYVQAVMDMICTGDYDHSVEFSDMEEGEASEILKEGIDEALAELAQTMKLDDETRDGFRDLILKAVAKSKYTVAEGVKAADGDGYDVTVTIQPLDFSAGMDEIVGEKVDELLSDPNVASMSESEITNVLMKAVIEGMNANLENPVYGESVDVTVRYHQMGEGVYGVEKEDGEKLGSSLFLMS